MSVDPVSEIERLVAFEGRLAGTDAERRAGVHLERRLRELGRDAYTEPTSIHPNYPVTHALHALIAIVGSVLSVTVPVAGAALVLFATVSAFGDLSGSFFLVRRLTGRRASQNVTSAEGGDKPGVVILTAHYDSARGRASRRFELFFWSMLAILVCTVLRLVGLEGTGLTLVQFVPTVVLIASIPLLVDIALSSVAEGASDNASGVATVLRLAERYGGRLEHFDVWVVLPGADEALLLGMRAWMRRHRRELDRERTVFVNVEAVGGGSVRWIEKEGLVTRMRYHPTLVELCEQIGEGRGLVSRQASSALAARAAGYPAITITLDPDSLDRAYAFCGALLERLDESVGPELA